MMVLMRPQKCKEAAKNAKASKQIVLNTPSDRTQDTRLYSNNLQFFKEAAAIDRLQVLHSFAIPVQKFMQLICCHWLLSPHMDCHGLPMSIDVCRLQLKFMDSQRIKQLHHVNPLCQRHLRTPV